MPLLRILFACLIPASVLGQIKITPQDLPKTGDEIYYSTSFTDFDYERAGANRTWDFSGLEPVTNDTFRFQNPHGTFLLAFFGSTELEIEMNGQTYYQFFKASNNAWTQTGVGATVPMMGFDIPLQYSDPDQVYKLPLTFNDSHTDTFGGSAIIQDMTVAVHGRRNSIVDGWGRITTPFGTFECIRVKSEITELDTLVFGIDNSRTEYVWLAKGQKIPVLQVTVFNVSRTPNILYRDSARGMDNAGIKPVVKKPLSLYPNPAQGQITFQLPDHLPGQASVGIFDLSGRCVFRQNIPGSRRQHTLDLHSLNDGFYLVKIDAGQTCYIQKLLLKK